MLLQVRALLLRQAIGLPLVVLALAGGRLRIPFAFNAGPGSAGKSSAGEPGKQAECRCAGLPVTEWAVISPG